jgi:hypothetical protein
MLHEQDLLEKDREILRLRKLLEEKEAGKKVGKLNISKLEEGGYLAHGISIVKMMNKRFDRDLLPYLMQIWRLKFLLKRTMKLQGSNIMMQLINLQFLLIDQKIYLHQRSSKCTCF